MLMRLRWNVSTALPLMAAAVFLVAVPGSLSAEARDGGFSAEDKARADAVIRPATDFSSAEAHEVLSGGAGTWKGEADAKAFSYPDATLDDAGRQNFALGFAIFRKMWAQAPSSTHASDGLGPLFNARSCQSCHVNDGRGHPPADGKASQSFLLRLARPAVTDVERKQIADLDVLNFPDPTYGHQLQDKGVTGLAGEGTSVVTYSERPVTLAGGETVMLREPHYSLRDLAYGPMDPKTTLSPRIAQNLIGMGLIEAIPEDQILAHAKPGANGIHGKANFVRDPVTGQTMLGRFGWKAQNATVREQAASALSNDIGISSPDAPNPSGDCTAAETACLKKPTGVQLNLGDTEAPDPVLPLLVAYTSHLAVPQRRDVEDPQVLAGKAQFYRAGCADCHVPKFVTGRDAANASLAFQLIWPYGDFLLHDMGPGLADGQQVGLATGSEWRTAPLWGIGLTKAVNGQEAYLHDGRARTLQEAILWHDGEARKARDAYAAMDRNDRQKLLRFLESL